MGSPEQLSPATRISGDIINERTIEEWDVVKPVRDNYARLFIYL
jgi:hypothetical protein